MGRGGNGKGGGGRDGEMRRTTLGIWKQRERRIRGATAPPGCRDGPTPLGAVDFSPPALPRGDGFSDVAGAARYRHSRRLDHRSPPHQEPGIRGLSVRPAGEGGSARVRPGPPPGARALLPCRTYLLGDYLVVRGGDAPVSTRA